MGLESSFLDIDDLNDAWPLGTDDFSKGDDHIRGIKHVLKTVFPTMVGQAGKVLRVNVGETGYELVANDLTALIPKSIGTTKGDMIAFTGSGVPVRKGVGSDFQFLISYAADPTGLTWTPVTSATVGLNNVTNDAQIPLSLGTTKGDLLSFTSASAANRLPIGTSGQILSSDPAEPMGLKWVTQAAGETNSHLEAAASGNLALTTSESDVPGATITLNKVGKWLVIGTFHFTVGDLNGVCLGRLSINGSTVKSVKSSALGVSGVSVDMTLTVSTVYNSAGTSVNAKLRGVRVGGSSNGLLEGAESNIVAVWLGA